MQAAVVDTPDRFNADGTVASARNLYDDRRDHSAISLGLLSVRYLVGVVSGDGVITTRE